MCLLFGLPFLIIAILVIVPLEKLREKRVIEWCNANGIHYKFMIGDREYPRIMQTTHKEIYTSNYHGPVKIRIGNTFWGLLSNDIERM